MEPPPSLAGPFPYPQATVLAPFPVQPPSDEILRAFPSEEDPSLPDPQSALPQELPSRWEPADSLKAFLRRREGQPNHEFFASLSPRDTLTPAPPAFVPSLGGAEGSLFNGDPDVEDKKREWDILGRMRKICRAQQKVSSQRGMLRQQRADLTVKRDDIADLGTELMDRLNGLVPELKRREDDSGLCSAIVEVVGIINQFQVSRDEYQVQELTYSDNENQMDTEELQLEQAENAFQHRLGQVSARHLMALFGDYDEPVAKTGSSDSALNTRRRHNPLAEYHFRIRDAEGIRESLWENATEHEALRQWVEMRLHYGLTVGEDTLATLRDYEEVRGEMLDELTQIETDIQRLKDECDEQGLDIHADPYEGRRKGSSTAGSFTAYDLLKPWRDKKPSYFERTPEVRDRVSTAQFIDKWLLDQLCQSSFQVLLRKHLGDAPDAWEGDDEDDDTFRQRVLGAWTTDHAVDTMFKQVKSDESSRAPADSYALEIEGCQDSMPPDTAPVNMRQDEPLVDPNSIDNTPPPEPAAPRADGDRSSHEGVQVEPVMIVGDVPNTEKDDTESESRVKPQLTTVAGRTWMTDETVCNPQDARVRGPKKSRVGLRSVVTWPDMSKGARRISQTLLGRSKRRLLNGNAQKSLVA